MVQPSRESGLTRPPGRIVHPQQMDRAACPALGPALPTLQRTPLPSGPSLRTTRCLRRHLRYYAPTRHPPPAQRRTWWSARSTPTPRTGGGDITYVPTLAGCLSIAIVLDVCSRRVVGWSMTGHLRTKLVLDALDMAVEQRRGVWCRRGARSGSASTTPWPRASSQPSNVNYSTARTSATITQRADQSSSSSRDGTTRIVVTGASVSNPRWPSRGATRKRHETQALHCPQNRGNSTPHLSCQCRPFFMQTTDLTAKPAYLLALCGAQSIGAPALGHARPSRPGCGSPGLWVRTHESVPPESVRYEPTRPSGAGKPAKPAPGANGGPTSAWWIPLSQRVRDPRHLINSKRRMELVEQKRPASLLDQLHNRAHDLPQKMPWRQ